MDYILPQYIKSPCKNCSDRDVGCHAKCEKYLAYRTELDAILLATEQGLRDALAVRSGMHSPLMLYSTSGQAQDATRHLTSGGLLGAVLEIEQTREFLTCNPNIKGVQALLADNLLRSIQK